jgi:hypothetical protein
MTTEVIDSHGSFIVRGPRYSVLQCRGPVSHRQQLARRSGCRAYVEQHLNAAGSVSPNYSTAIVGPGCERSRAMAREYTRLCAAEFRIRDGGVLVGHRGFGNVANAGCPHFLAEPGFVSNPEFAGIARTGEGIDAMARCLAQAIRTHIPGGLVGLSVGHKYRETPDPGAPVYVPPGAPRDGYLWEADIADAIVTAATELLVSIP